jgi:hypothetical protein
MNADLTPKNANNKNCEICDFVCIKQSEWIRHLNTRKHKNRIESNGTEQKNATFVCKLCNKEYKARNSLWYHEQKCKNIIVGNNQINNIELKIIDNEPENEVVTDSSNNEIIKLLIKENSDFKSIIIEMMKSNSDMMKSNTDIIKNNTDMIKNNTDLQKQMLEVCKNIQPSNTTNNTINANDNRFNLNVFLNEKCKNAMNLDDFANSIQLKLSDLIRVGEEGYVPGMSKVFIEWLGDIKECDRPIHCSDEKREAIQVKMADKWEKEAIDSVNLMNAVRIVEQKQFDMLTTFRDTYPECMNSESHHNDMLIKLFQNLSNSKQPEFIKVIKKVAKAVIINKEKHA